MPDKNKCYNYKLPCAKFIICAGLSIGGFTFSCVMLATGGLSAPLAPLYASIISGTLSIWCPSPEYNNNNVIQIDNTHDNKYEGNHDNNINLDHDTNGV